VQQTLLPLSQILPLHPFGCVATLLLPVWQIEAEGTKDILEVSDVTVSRETVGSAGVQIIHVGEVLPTLPLSI
jgi:hypothetical protein